MKNIKSTVRNFFAVSQNSWHYKIVSWAHAGEKIPNSAVEYWAFSVPTALFIVAFLGSLVIFTFLIYGTPFLVVALVVLLVRKWTGSFLDRLERGLARISRFLDNKFPLVVKDK